jgi:hypothetical protein
MAFLVLMGGDVAVDRAHHLPGARHLHVARVLLDGEPPPRHRQARDPDPASANFGASFLGPVESRGR